MTLCAIHQPNFFPWLGYFDKIHRADVFVFLDAVDYPRAGSGGMGSWTNRVKINVQGAEKWVGCPIEKSTGGGAICDVRISPDPNWKRKLIRTLMMNYKRAARFERAMALLQPLIESEQDLVADYNIDAITTIAAAIGVSAKFVRQSSLGTRHASTDLLVEICQKTQSDGYLAGGGATGYQENDKFAGAGLDLVEQRFEPFRYQPGDGFIPGLSIIDFLMHSEEWNYESALRAGA